MADDLTTVGADEIEARLTDEPETHLEALIELTGCALELGEEIER